MVLTRKEAIVCFAVAAKALGDWQLRPHQIVILEAGFCKVYSSQNKYS